ncbi:MAG: hypothetical protein J3K34DRAFT_488648 [Monoraphidium minutum]|nr:MAG: hypothetical protein J3K34DRAFT_488648 [Monoraphidium minutum]
MISARVTSSAPAVGRRHGGARVRVVRAQASDKEGVRSLLQSAAAMAVSVGLILAPAPAFAALPPGVATPVQTQLDELLAEKLEKIRASDIAAKGAPKGTIRSETTYAADRQPMNRSAAKKDAPAPKPAAPAEEPAADIRQAAIEASAAAKAAAPAAASAPAPAAAPAKRAAPAAAAAPAGGADAPASPNAALIGGVVAVLAIAGVALGANKGEEAPAAPPAAAPAAPAADAAAAAAPPAAEPTPGAGPQ